MSLGLYEQRRRRVQRQRAVTLGWLLVLGLVVALGTYAYRSGAARADAHVAELDADNSGLMRQVEQLKVANAELQDRLEDRRSEIASWQDRYERDVPTGNLRELMALMRQRLDDGITAQRLAFVVGMASDGRTCDEPVIKRFIVQTSLTSGANNVADFGDQEITITANGTEASSSAGSPEAWFDPVKPVTVRFTAIGGETEEITQTLPLHHALVAGNNEYRFTVLPGPRAFLNVTAERCDYP